MCEKTKKRNIKLLSYLLDKYFIKKNIEDMVNYKSVFVSQEFDKPKKDITQDEDRKLKRAILYANTEKKNKKEILYNFGSKKIKMLNDEEIDKTILELLLISSFVKQLKKINEIELIEEIDIKERMNTLKEFD